MLSNLAKLAGLNFENNGVNVKLSNPYFAGSARTQILQICEAANIGHIIDNNTLAIWPAGQPRGGATAMISKDTILVGYPGFNSQGVVVKCLWDPSIVPMGKIQVQSDITPANGPWTIYAMDYDMASMMPGGPWFVTLSASKMAGIS
jgi:hypothetical protein